MPDLAYSTIEAARHDPNPFVEYVLDVEQSGIHEATQDFYSRHNDCYVELPRGHGKTVQTAARIAWEIGRHPEDRWKYVQASLEEAKETVDLIRRIVESPRYKSVFPNLTPDPTLWGKHAFRFILKDRLQRDPTVEACGIFDNPGGRADGFIFDDICTLKNAIQQPALRTQVKEAYANTHMPMIDRSRDRQPRIWRIGTCWHVDDITADWRRQCGQAGTLFRQPVIDYISPWPAVFTPRILRAYKGVIPPDEALPDDPAPLGVIAYARAFELVPVSSEQLVFEPAWLDGAMYEELSPDIRNARGACIGALDFAFTEEAQKNDPDWSVFAVGYKFKGHFYCEDMIRMRSQFPAFAAAASALGDRYAVRQATAEANGAQKALVQIINAQSGMGFKFPVTPINRTQDKISRAAGVQAFFAAGRFHMRARREGGVLRPIPALGPMYDELVSFPAGGHDDCVDVAIDLAEAAQSNSGCTFKATRLNTWNPIEGI